MRRIFAAAAVVCACVSLVAAQSLVTVVPGQARKADANGNGIPDVGVVVNGHYTAIYAYDYDGGWYFDLGDGRVQGTVGSPAELDQQTLTSCQYENNFRGTFEDTPFLDSGWVQNHIDCTGFEHGTYEYLIVHKSDPRYTGNPAWAIWGDWEYHVLTQSGSGNLIKRLPRP